MKIGISIGYNNLDNYSKLCKESGINISHLQIIGIPVELENVMAKIIRNIEIVKSVNPAIEISFHAFPGINFTERVKEVRELWIKYALDLIRFAGSLKASFVNFHAGYMIGPSTMQRNQKSREALLPVLMQLIDTAKLWGLEIHLENLYRVARECDFRYIGDRLADFKYVFEQIDDVSFKLCYDYGNGNLNEDGIEILRLINSRLGSIHAHDNDQILHVQAAMGHKGLGTINWDKEWKYLRDIGFYGPVIVEGGFEEQMQSLLYISKLEQESWK